MKSPPKPCFTLFHYKMRSFHSRVAWKLKSLWINSLHASSSHLFVFSAVMIYLNLIFPVSMYGDPFITILPAWKATWSSKPRVNWPLWIQFRKNEKLSSSFQFINRSQMKILLVSINSNVVQRRLTMAAAQRCFHLRLLSLMSKLVQ